MLNRAKCKRCSDILEIKEGELVYCSCGEIVLNGIDKRVVCNTSVTNYVEVDELGNEIVLDISSPKPDRKALLEMLDEMVKKIEEMPSHVMQAPVNHYDFASALLLISTILKNFD